MQRLKHLIIGGANKCGTTALFRYLSDHPSICGSTVKELHFFERADYTKLGNVRNEYLKNFPTLSDTHRILLEATPSYLDGGRDIAQRIDSALPDSRIIFMLRDPVDRFISYYKSQQGWVDSPAHGISFAETADKALHSRSMKEAGKTPGHPQLSAQIDKGEYWTPLSGFYDTLGSNRVKVIFFDQFQRDPGECISELARLCGFSTEHYRSYDYRIENKSRMHRSASLRTLASQANLRLEPVLNRLPRVRYLLRSVYNQVNVAKAESFTIDDESVATLRRHYAPHNAALGALLHTHGVADFPTWVRSADADALSRLTAVRDPAQP